MIDGFISDINNIKYFQYALVDATDCECNQNNIEMSCCTIKLCFSGGGGYWCIKQHAVSIWRFMIDSWMDDSFLVLLFLKLWII